MSNISNSYNKHQASVPLNTILKEFKTLLTLESGPSDLDVSGPCSQENPSDHSIVFINDETHFSRLLETKVKAIVVPTSFKSKMNGLDCRQKTIISSPNTYLSMALVNAHFFQLPYLKKPFAQTRLHPTAVIHPEAKVSETAIISPGVVISSGVEIGEHTFIGANSVIEPNTRIGADCYIHALVYIGHSCVIGNRVEIKPHSTIASDGYGYAHDDKGNHHRIPHFGAVIIEDNVHIGANVNIDRGTFEPSRIGAGTKIDNHCHFGHNVRIGKNCLITAGMITAGSATIGDRCIFGGRCSVNGHITITNDCTFAGLSAVTNNILKPGKYGGFPTHDFRDFLKIQSGLRAIPELRKNVSRLMKKLGLESEHQI